MDDLATERSFDLQATLVNDVLHLFFDKQVIRGCWTVGTTRHWQVSGRLLQELNVCSVDYLQSMISSEIYR